MSHQGQTPSRPCSFIGHQRCKISVRNEIFRPINFLAAAAAAGRSDHIPPVRVALLIFIAHQTKCLSSYRLDDWLLQFHGILVEDSRSNPLAVYLLCRRIVHLIFVQYDCRDAGGGAQIFVVLPRDGESIFVDGTAAATIAPSE